jgi:hypothetical protein
MPRFQVEMTVTGNGCIELDADDAKAARIAAVKLNAEIYFPYNASLDTSLFDSFADIHVDGVNEVEPEVEPTEEHTE